MEIYSLTDAKKYNIDNLPQKHLLFKQFIAWACNDCSTAPLSDYINNPVYQELTDKSDYNGDTRDERVYLDLRSSLGYTTEIEKIERNDSKINLFIQLKKNTTKNLRLRIWTYSHGLTLRHKIYRTVQEDNNFLEWENNP